MERITWTFYADDMAGNRGFLTIYINVVDTSSPEILTQLEDKSITYDDEIAFDMPVVRDCNNYFIDYYDEQTGENCQEGFDLIRTWIVSDVCGNFTEVIQTIHVEDPVFDSFDNSTNVYSVDDAEDVPLFFNPNLREYEADNPANSGELVIRPVPAQYEVMVDFMLVAEGLCNVVIFSMNGNQVYSSENELPIGEHTLTFDISGFEAGT